MIRGSIASDELYFRLIVVDHKGQINWFSSEISVDRNFSFLRAFNPPGNGPIAGVHLDDNDVPVLYSWPSSTTFPPIVDITSVLVVADEFFMVLGPADSLDDCSADAIHE